MLAELFTFLFEKAETYSNPEPHIRKLDARTQVVTIRGAQYTEVLDPKPMTRYASSLASVVALTEKYGKEPTVYLGHTGINVVLDESDRQEFVLMRFVQSEPLRTLTSLDQGVTQKQLIRILRTTLAGYVSQDSFLEVMRQLEFDVSRGGRSEIQASKESLGRSIEKEVRAKAGEMPETINVRVPYFSIPSDIKTWLMLECAVTVDIDSETVSLTTTGDCLAREQEAALNDIEDFLRGELSEDTLVVRGTCETKS